MRDVMGCDRDSSTVEKDERHDRRNKRIGSIRVQSAQRQNAQREFKGSAETFRRLETKSQFNRLERLKQRGFESAEPCAHLSLRHRSDHRLRERSTYLSIEERCDCGCGSAFDRDEA